MKTLATNTIQFLAGGGEMGALTRKKDWSKTLIGRPENWPQSLYISLNIILQSRFPMFLFWGPDLVCFYNDAYRPSLGENGKHPSILGMKAIDAWPEIWHIIKPLIDIIMEGGEATWSEDQLIPIYRNGNIEDVYWTFSYSAVNDECGKVVGVLVTCTETTDKIKSVKLLQESNNQLLFTIEAAELATWDFDTLNGKLQGNNRLKEWAGLPLTADIDLSLAITIVAEKDKERVVKAVQHSLQYSSGGNYDIEYTIINRITDEERIVRAKGRAWFNDEKVCYRFNGTLQDITSNAMFIKKIEESETRFRKMVETIPEIAWAASPDGPYSFYNKRFYEYTGMSVEKSHKDWKWKSIVHPDMFEMRNKIWEHSLATGEDFYFESLLKRNIDQSYRWHISRAAAIKDDKGEITLWVGTSTDIHVQKLFAQELEKQVKTRTKALIESITNLQQSNENLEQFASIASHDLQEPLRKIQTFTNLIEQRYKNDFPEGAKILLDKIKNSSERMSGLIRGVLNFSRITQSNQEFVNVDMNETLKNVLKDFELLIQENRVIVNTANLPKIEGVALQINQMLYNLISNAIKFSKNGSQCIITLHSRKFFTGDLKKYPDLDPSLDYYEIVFKDDGIGFDQQFAEEIFLIFHRLNDHLQYSGTGIGLALCKKIVDNHHGKIFAEGKENEGAVFHIILPVKQKHFL
jgi:PAS domain S-box-containing protein